MSDLRPLMARIPERVRKKLELAAKKNGHSLNSELNRRLEESFRGDQIMRVLKRIQDRLDE